MKEKYYLNDIANVELLGNKIMFKLHSNRKFFYEISKIQNHVKRKELLGIISAL